MLLKSALYYVVVPDFTYCLILQIANRFKHPRSSARSRSLTNYRESQIHARQLAISQQFTEEREAREN